MKTHTDLEQSMKLSEILPIDSADMNHSRKSNGHSYVDYAAVGNPNNMNYYSLPCWSLAALLDALPYTIKLSHDTIDANGNPAYKNESYKFSINRCGLFGDKWNIQYYGKHQRQLGKRYKELYIDLFFSESHDNLIDACYEMMVKLHEQKVL